MRILVFVEARHAARTSCSPPWSAVPPTAMRRLPPLLPGSRVTPEELMSFIRFQLTSYKRPSKIVILDVLPASSTGKIRKHKLAESLRGGGGEPLRRGRSNFRRRYI